MNTKQPKKKQDHNKQTRKPLSDIVLFTKTKAANTDTKQCNFIV